MRDATSPLDDAELARRAVHSFGELLATLADSAAAGGAREGVLASATSVRKPDILGARFPAATESPWIDAAVVPYGAAPPADAEDLPACLWAAAAAVPGRVERPAIAMPCMSLRLDEAHLPLEDGAPSVAATTLEELGALNDRAYGQRELLRPLLGAARDARLRAHGLRQGDELVCVAATLTLGDDLGVHYVATPPNHQRRGLATSLLLTLLATARAAGLRTASLQASPAGAPVYERLGFRRVTSLRAFVRPAPPR
jgi:GNAT superfamily N-acetyltransferase